MEKRSSYSNIIAKRFNGFALLALTFHILLLLPLAAQADTITVDANGTGDYPTIQTAIDDANNGDIVLLSPGIYTGDGNRDLDFLGKAITVSSINPNDPCTVAATIIDCNGLLEKDKVHCGLIFHLFSV